MRNLRSLAVSLKWCLFAALCVAAFAFAQPEAAPAPSSTAQGVASLPWLQLLATVLLAVGAWMSKNLVPLAGQALAAHAADKNQSATSQKLATFGAGLLQQVNAAASHIFQDAQVKLAGGESIDDLARNEGTDLLNGLDQVGHGLAQQYLGTGGALLLDTVEGLIKNAVHAKVAAAQQAGALAAMVAVPKAPAAIAGPKAAVAVDAASDAAA